MILRNKLVFSVIFLFVVSSASVFAGTFEFIDTTSEVPGSTFTLTITPTTPGTFNAILSVDTTGANSPGTFINYFTLHLTAGSTRPLVTPINLPTNWKAIGSGEPDVDVLKRKGFPQNNWVGFHTDGIVVNGAVDITGGVELLIGGGELWDFDFTLAPGSILNESPSIQVGYFGGSYDGRGRYKIKFTQMSQSVPEPSTLILLLSGTGILAGAAGFRRKMK